MKTLELIAKTREYLDYIEEHVLNVQKAFEIANDKWKNDSIIYDDWKWHELKGLIECHDDCKLSEDEFVQYRKYFYPTDTEEHYANSTHGVPSTAFAQEGFDNAWEHHKANTRHHWETMPTHPIYRQIFLAEMVLDWIAMSMKFGGTAIEYYEKEKQKIEISSSDQSYALELMRLWYS